MSQDLFGIVVALPSKSLGSMSSAPALDHTTAACALSRMTSQSIPVKTSRSSVPGIMVISTEQDLPTVFEIDIPQFQVEDSHS